MNTRWALFGEVLATGLLVVVAGFPVVTLPAALAAGVAHLRRHLHGRPTTVRRYAADTVAAARVLLLPTVALLGLAVVVTINFDLVGTGALPGGAVVRLASLAALGLALAVLLRAVGCWSDEEGVAGRRSTLDLFRTAGERARRDPSGSGLALFAVLAVAWLPTFVLPLVIVVGGLASMAVVAIDIRASEQQAD